MNVGRIERKTEQIIRKLGIESYVDNIEFRTEPSNLYGCIERTLGGYSVIVYINDCTEKEIMHTIAHELRHIWQRANGFKIEGKYKHLYYKTYNSNIFEIDANRFADIVVNKKRYKANEEGLYVNSLDIAKYGLHILIAKAIA